MNMNPWGLQPNQWQPVYHPQSPQYPFPPGPTNAQWAPSWATSLKGTPDHLKKIGISAAMSSKYPHLNPALAPDTVLIRFDISKKARNTLGSEVWHAHAGSLATAVPCRHLRLISKLFPWTIEIVVYGTAAVTCEAVWDALYAALQEEIMDSEWGFITMDKKKREATEKAHEKRIKWDMDTRYKRIDYLGDALMFKGLEKDTEFEGHRVMKGVEPCAETWVVKLGT